VKQTIDGVEVPWVFEDFEREVRTLRSSVGVSVIGHVQATRIAGPGAFDLLDQLCPCELFVHDGQMKQTLILDRASGAPIADVYVCADGDEYLLISEGLPAPALDALLAEHARDRQVTIHNFRDTHTFLSINGPFAWELLAELEGPGAVGFPYLTFYRPSPERIYFRAGKTGEFGYDLLVPSQEAESFFALLLERGRAFDARPVGVRALFHASLENWFFNIHREGQTNLLPIELQLQWRITYDKVERRACTRRVTPIRAAAAIAAGDVITCDGTKIGEVLVAERSVTLGAWIAIALLDVDYAWSGIVDRYRANDVALTTVSAPFVNNLSLYVNVHRDRYARRHEIKFPGPARR
jgi:glycine cleavage system aminomethyltransferase T